jgi:hypothetical protein
MIITAVLTILAAIFNALMDWHSENTKGDTWRNKWKQGDPKLGERFFLSSTVLVFLTDKWHFTQFLFHTSWQLAISIQFDYWYIYFIAIKITFSGVFELIYNNLKKRK